MASHPESASPYFASGMLGFVSGTRRRLVSVIVLTIALAASLAGAFGTHAIPWPRRTLFWLLILGWNLIKWELLIVVLRRRGFGHSGIALAGSALMLATIPFEVAAALRLLSNLIPAPLGGTFLRVAGLTLIALVVAIALAPRLIAAKSPAPASASAETPRFPGTAIRLDAIAAIVAEDHYVRLHLADGSDRLVLGRLRDAMARMEGIAGAQIHRGAWAADAHRGAARRAGNRWYLHVGSALELPVSRRLAPALRDRGWLSR